MVEICTTRLFFITKCWGDKRNCVLPAPLKLGPWDRPRLTLNSSKRAVNVHQNESHVLVGVNDT